MGAHEPNHRHQHHDQANDQPSDQPTTPRLPDDRFHDGWWYLPLRRPLSAIEDDAIRATVAKRLDSDAWTRDEPIEVDVRQRVAVLTGTVGSPTIRDAAIGIARSTPGVASVNPQLHTIHG